MGLPGLEPGTSSLSEKHNTLQEVSRVCKIPANIGISALMRFTIFQDIRLGCCTIAAQLLHTEGAQQDSNLCHAPTLPQHTPQYVQELLAQASIALMLENIQPRPGGEAE